MNSSELNHGEICMSCMEMIGIESLYVPFRFLKYRAEQRRCPRGAFAWLFQGLHRAVSEFRQAE
jgi:hypothetical protein